MGTLVIAEDEPDIRNMYVAQVEDLLGAKVIAVDSGEAMVRAVLGGADAAIADYGLNGLNGAEATRIIRAHGYEIPIFMVSASDVKKQALEAGATEFLLKPSGIEVIINKLSQMKEFAAAIAMAASAQLYLQAQHL